MNEALRQTDAPAYENRVMESNALKAIHNADLIWAELTCGKLDGKFFPLWISQVVVDRMGKPGARFIHAKTHMIRLNDATEVGILRKNITDVKGPSATWPEGLEILRGPDGEYVAKRLANGLANEKNTIPGID